MVHRFMVDLANPCFQCRVMDLLLHCNSTMGFRWTINRNNSNRPGIKLQELEEGENKMTLFDQINIHIWKEPDNTFGATTADPPFNHISGFGDTKLEALKEFCIAMLGAIEVVIEDKESNDKEIKKVFKETKI